MYQWNADDYAKNSKGQEAWAQELLALLQLRTGERVLDIGCGDGRTTAAIAAQAPDGAVLGLDLSEDMVRHANARYASGHLRFVQGDARSLNFDDEFTLVFSNASLHWVKDHRPILAGIAKALKKNGRVLAQMGGFGNGAGLIAAFDEIKAKPEWRNYFIGFESPYGFHRPKDYVRWLDEAGLQAGECELIPKDMVHTNRSAFSGWIRTAWHPYTACVPADARDIYIEQVADVYLASFPMRTNGSIHVQMIRLQMQAHKR